MISKICANNFHRYLPLVCCTVPIHKLVKLVQNRKSHNNIYTVTVTPAKVKLIKSKFKLGMHHNMQTYILNTYFHIIICNNACQHAMLTTSLFYVGGLVWFHKFGLHGVRRESERILCFCFVCEMGIISIILFFTLYNRIYQRDRILLYIKYIHIKLHFILTIWFSLVVVCGSSLALLVLIKLL